MHISNDRVLLALDCRRGPSWLAAAANLWHPEDHDPANAECQSRADMVFDEY